MSRLLLPPFRHLIGHRVAATLGKPPEAGPPPACGLVVGDAVATGGVISVDSGPCEIVHTFSSSGTFTLDAVGILRVAVTFTGTGSFGSISADGTAYVDPAGTTVTVTSGDVIVSYDPDVDYVDGMAAFFDPSIASTVNDTAGSVDSHDDLTTAWTATAPGSGNRPITGTRTIGGLNGFDYDGSNDCLQIPSWSTTTTFAIFAVLKWDSVASFKMMMETGTDVGASSRGVALYGASPNLEFLVRGASGLGVKRFAYSDTTNPHAFTFEADGTFAGMNCRIDGVDQSVVSSIATNPGASATTLTMNLGARNGGSIGWDGIYGPWIAFLDGNKPGATARGLVEDYLSFKWGTP